MEEDEKIRKYRRLAAEAVIVVEDRDEEIAQLKRKVEEFRNELAAKNKYLDQYRVAVITDLWNAFAVTQFYPVRTSKPSSLFGSNTIEQTNGRGDKKNPRGSSKQAPSSPATSEHDAKR